MELSKKFLAQSWYLSPELIGFSLFSYKGSVDTKQVIVRNLEIGSDWNVRKVKASVTTLHNAKNLEDFVDESMRSVLKNKIVGM